MFSLEDFLQTAELRFGGTNLRQRMRGAAANDVNAQDLELRKIAHSVFGRVQDAVDGSVGWPLPGAWPAGSEDAAGADISGTLYADAWPPNLLQKALELFNWRTLSGLEAVSDNQRKVGEAAEKWFQALEDGDVGLGIGLSTEISTNAPAAARSRDGSSLIGDTSQENLLETFRLGRSWNG